MSKIKVGDKVRVVLILVKECDTERHTTRRMSYLGGEGKVTCISPRLPSAIHVQLKQCLVTHVFDPVELEMLGVPCEHKEPDERVSCLREELLKLHDLNREMLATNDRLRKRIGELKRLNESVHKGNVEAGETNMRLVEENERLNGLYTAVLQSYDHVRERELEGNAAFARLQRSRKELQEQYEELIRASATTRAKIRNILNAAQRT